MNSSIFNFEENTSEIKEFVSTRVLMLFSFMLLFTFLIVNVISSGCLRFVNIVIAGMLVLIYIFQKHYRPSFIVIISFGILFLVIGELYFRVNYFGMDSIKYFRKYVPAGIGSPLSTLEYDDNTYTGLKVNSRGIFKGEFFETNNLGFRDENRYIEKNSDTIRIVVCGTSISMGAGVAQGENYSAYLEEMLNHWKKSKKFEVINLAVGGYRMSDMVDVLLRYGVKFDTDIVLIEDSGWDSNALHPKKEFKGSKKQLFKMTLSRPFEKLFFFNAIRDEYILPYIRPKISFLKSTIGGKIYNRLKKVKNRLMGIEGESGEKLKTDRKTDQTRYQMQRYYLEKIKNITQGKSVYIVSLRSMRHLQRDAKEKTEMKTLCSEYGFKHIDTSKEDFGSNDREMIVYIGDRHPNAKAHKIYARAILNAIKPGIEAELAGR